LAGYAGDSVVGQAVPVQSALSGQDLWVGTDPTNRVFVLVSTSSSVQAGELVSFSGSVVANPDGFGTNLALPSSDAAQLASEGAHIEVQAVTVQAGATTGRP
jgi:hypothetical protein